MWPGGGVSLESVTVGQGNDMEILGCIEKAQREDSWVLIENVHLMNDKMLKELKYFLQRIGKHRGESWFLTGNCN